MLIGISGKQRVGKDTVGDYLSTKYGFTKKHFADPLKKMVVKFFGIPKYEVYQTKPERVRKILQEVGQIGRDVDPLFWVHKLFDEYVSPTYHNIVIADVRYRSEANYIRDLGGYLVRMYADDDIRKQRGVVSHEYDLSETELDDYKFFDYYITNNYSKEVLYRRVDGILEDILAKEYEKEK